MFRKFIFKDETSNKFWNIEINGKSFNVTFGKTGTNGQTQTKKFDSEDVCKKTAEKLIKEKLNKGYIENPIEKKEKDTVKTVDKSLSLIDKARDFVKNYPMPEEISLFAKEKYYYCNDNSKIFLDDKKIDMDILSQSLHYFISINCKKITDEKKVKLGVSKIKGLPHLPDSVEWPEDHYFFAQINLKELSKFDIENYLPHDGMLYIFFNPEEGNLDCKVIHYNGKESLSVVTYPKEKMYYQKDFLKSSSIMELNSNYIFLFGSRSDYSKLSKIIDKSIKDKISKILKCEISGSDSIPNIFGQPLYFQSEGTVSYKEHIKNINVKSPFLLLFQGEFGEGAVHFWIDKKDLKKNDFSKCYVTYSGT